MPVYAVGPYRRVATLPRRWGPTDPTSSVATLGPPEEGAPTGLPTTLRTLTEGPPEEGPPSEGPRRRSLRDLRRGPLRYATVGLATLSLVGEPLRGSPPRSSFARPPSAWASGGPTRAKPWGRLLRRTNALVPGQRPGPQGRALGRVGTFGPGLRRRPKL